MQPSWLNREEYPFRSRFISTEGADLHLLDEGEGSPVVFAHGTPTWSFEYRHLIHSLRARHRCLAPDHLGFGLSSRPKDADYSPEAHARRFSNLMDQLALPRLSLVVHDFGGPIALDWALRNSERVERLIVLNSWMWSFEDDAKMAKRARMIDGALGRFLYRHLNASLKLIMPSAYADRAKLTQAIHAQYLNVFPDADSRERVLFALAKSLLGSSAHFAKLWASREKLKNIPIGIIWGMKDAAFEPHNLERWSQAFPQAKVFRLKDAGHWPHEENPEAVLAAMTELGL